MCIFNGGAEIKIIFIGFICSLCLALAWESFRKMVFTVHQLESIDLHTDKKLARILKRKINMYRFFYSFIGVIVILILFSAFGP